MRPLATTLWAARRVASIAAGRPQRNRIWWVAARRCHRSARGSASATLRRKSSTSSVVPWRSSRSRFGRPSSAATYSRPCSSTSTAASAWRTSAQSGTWMLRGCSRSCARRRWKACCHSCVRSASDCMGTSSSRRTSAGSTSCSRTATSCRRRSRTCPRFSRTLSALANSRRTPPSRSAARTRAVSSATSCCFAASQRRTTQRSGMTTSISTPTRTSA
mmetsp:Transcript_20061/g.56889  ORF Transcript_20061/g.56889 Transcript_20061/m.56889 type:complete len:218 (+) Transcript_20061:335-988(+)